MFRQKDPKPLAPGRGPAGAFAPSRLLGLPSTSGALRLTLRMNGFSLPIHPSPHPFVLSPSTALRTGVTEWSRRALRQSSPPNRMFGPGAQPRPQAPGCGAVFQVVIPSVTRNLHFSFSVIPDIFNRGSSVVAFLFPLLNVGTGPRACPTDTMCRFRWTTAGGCPYDYKDKD